MVKSFWGIIKKCLKSFFIYAKNSIKYGRNAPLFEERIWVPVNEIKYSISQESRKDIFGTRHSQSGKVYEGTWYKYVDVIENKEVYKDCYNHWVKGIPWSETGRFETKLKTIKKRGEVDGCKNLSDLKERYRLLDKVFEEVKKEKYFKTQEELSGKRRFFFKGKGEIEICIGKNGELIHGSGGNHRLCIAKILSIKKIPAKVGMVHPDGIYYLKQYRRKK